MRNLLKETNASFGRFVDSWEKDLNAVSTELAKDTDRFLESYRRIVSLQAWKSSVLETTICDDSLAFFIEAQNDALTSHVLGRLGAWRTALKSLRSCIENVLFCLYYMEHPVELVLWHSHKHRLQFSELIAYFRKHPKVDEYPDQVTGLAELEKEYSILSAAVHASGRSFRMSSSGDLPQLWNSDSKSKGAWSTRERRTLAAINLLLLTVFRDYVNGAKLSNLRKAVSLAVPLSIHGRIRSKLNIRLMHK